MKKFRKLIISILSLLPLGPISVAAQTKLLDIQENPNFSEHNWNEIMGAKSMLFPSYATTVHIDKAREIFRTKSQITDPAIFEQEFSRTVEYLSKKGMLIKNGKFMRSGAPSEGGIISN